MNKPKFKFSDSLKSLYVLILIFALSSGNAFTAKKASSFKNALKLADLDLNASKIIRGKKVLDNKHVSRVMLSILGYRKATGESIALVIPDKRTDQRNNTESEMFATYLFVFKKEMPIGTILVDEAKDIFLLKSGIDTSKITLDASNKTHWQKVAKAKMTNGTQSIITLPNDAKSKAILVHTYSAKPKRYVHQISYFRIFKTRFGNISPLAIANAESEHTVYPLMSSPFTLSASHIPQGKGSWRNTGPNKDGKIPRGPISDVTPSWFILSWDKAHLLNGYYIESNINEFECFAYTGPEGINPSVANDREWKKIRDWKDIRERGHPASRNYDRFRIITFKTPIKSRGLKIKITRTNAGPVAEINSLHVYSDLGRGQVTLPKLISVVPPFSLSMNAPIDGTMSLVINDNKGNRVANVQGRILRKSGKLEESWNLKNIYNEPVAPGTYSYTALFMPKLSIKYQMTPYPNVENNSNNTPWPQGHSGPGAWLADHSSIGCVTAGNNGKMYFGAGCAESGQALAETDLEGAKEWGHHNFVAWTGPSFLAFGGNTLFAASRAHWNLTDHVWTVNAKDKTEETFLAIKSTNQRARGISGMTYRDGKLYLAIDAKANWLSNAADGDDVASEHCLPKYKVRDKEETYGPDTRNDFKRLFRLTGSPAGQGNPGTQPGLTFIESTDYPSSKNHTLLTFKRPVAIGSLIFPQPRGDYQMRIKVLKKNAAFPPKPNKSSDWVEIYRSRTGSDWQVVTAPEGLKARALCLTYSLEDDDLLDELNEDEEGSDATMEDDDSLSDSGTPWKARLEGMKIMRRRFKAAVEGLTIRTSSGSINKHGEWDAKRTSPINEADPAVYLMQWDKEQSLRGLAIKEIDGKRTFIDVYTGPVGEMPLKGNKNWRRISTYEQKLRYYYEPDPNRNDRARYIDGYVDFGEEVITRAVRLSVVEQWTTRKEGRAGLVGVREDRGAQALSATRCHVYGVAALSYLGGEASVDPLTYNRLEVYDAKSKKLLKEVPGEKLGKVTVDSNGRLYAQLGKNIGILQKDDTWKIHISDLIKPSGMATDKDNNLYVFDADSSRKQVRVYNAQGEFVRTIGKVGGYKQGPFDPEYITASGIEDDTDMAIDSNSKLWITQSTYELKRISRWTTAGAWQKDFYGNTSYGGGGVLDITNTNRLFYSVGNMTVEFGLDWKTGKTKVNAIPWLGDSQGGEYVIPIDGRIYLVSRPLFGRQSCGFVYLYDNNTSVMRRVAALGSAGAFYPLKNKIFNKKLGNRSLGDLQFVWSDLNSDGNPQPDEVTFFKPHTSNTNAKVYVSWFDETLGIQSQFRRFEVSRFLSSGVPIYKAIETPNLGVHSRRMNKNQFFRFNHKVDRNSQIFSSLVDSTGKTKWKWKTEGMGVHAYYKAGPFTSRQVVAEFDVIGTSQDNGELGDIFVTNTNTGMMHIWTYDGILAGSLFQDIRSKQRISPPAIKPVPGAIEMNKTTLGQEHFSGWYGKSQNGKHYVVTGHNYIGVSEVLGLNKAKRITGTFTVKAEDLRKTHEWEKTIARKISYDAAKVYNCPIGDDKKVDGELTDWSQNFISPDDYEGIEFAMHVGEKNLYLAYRVINNGPLLNMGGSGWQRYFKTGGAVDIMLGTDPNAKPDRKGPAKGDLRLLITHTPKGNKVVLYQPTVENPNSAEAWQAKTMVFTTNFDRVVELKTAKIVYVKDEKSPHWVLEASIPLEELGLKVKKRERLRFDFGLMKTNEGGNEVQQRIYWANKSTSILSDVAAEASLEPAQWGHVIFCKEGTGAGGEPVMSSGMLGDEDEDDEEMTEDELLDEMDNL